MVNKDELEALKKYWDEQLEQSGFEDIEKVRKKIRPFRDKDSKQAQAVEDYYALLSEAVQDETTYFRNETDRYILARYAEGIRIKDIVQELTERNTSRTRLTIRIVIRRYEMAWGIRFYTRKELHLK